MTGLKNLTALTGDDPRYVGPYQVVGRLGEGGMGTVYAAVHPDNGERVAVKTLKREFAADPAYRARFRREVGTLRAVTGPYVVPLLDADPTADRPWLVTAYVPGPTLHEHVVRHGPLVGSTLVSLAAGVAHALACIHAAKVTHRDLKPANVILAADGPRVLDFGIAHHLDATGITTTGITGTHGWMAPEQFLQGTTTQATDVFVWGILVAFAATGLHPFGTPTGIDHRIVHAQPTLDAVPTPLRALVGEALAKDPATRPTAVRLVQVASRGLDATATLAFPTVALTTPDPSAVPTTRLDFTSSLDPTAHLALAASLAATEVQVGRLTTAAWDLPPVEEPHWPPTRVAAHPAVAAGAPAPAVTAPRPATAPRDRSPSVPRQVRPEFAREQVRFSTAPRPPAPPEAPTVPRASRRPIPRSAVVLGTAVLAAATGFGIAMFSPRPTHTPAGPAAGHTPLQRPAREPESASPLMAVPGTAGPTPAVRTSSPAPSPATVRASGALFGGLGFTAPEGWTLDPAPDQNGQSPNSIYGQTVALRPVAADRRTGVVLSYIPYAPPELDTKTLDLFPEETVTRTTDNGPTSIAGLKAQSFTFATDQEPDYDGSRKHTHRAWWLPESHYLVYTAGDLTDDQSASVEAVVESMAFTGVQQMPKDCADAVRGLDVGVAHATDAPHPETFQSCIDQTSTWTGAHNTTGSPAVPPSSAIDPGTVGTRTEAVCVALVTHYLDGGLMSDDSPDTYNRLRRSCDIPR